MKRLFVCTWLILSLLLTGGAAAPHTAPVHTIESTIEHMRQPGVKVTIVTMDCGEVNAYYSPALRLVMLCNELEEVTSPAFTRFVLAHELAHAIIMQRDLPYTGSHEVAADELAAVILSLYGDQEAVMAAAAYFIESAQEDEPRDDHPGDLKRGFVLACIAKGSQGVTADFCTVEWPRLSRAWMRLLGY